MTAPCPGAGSRHGSVGAVSERGSSTSPSEQLETPQVPAAEYDTEYYLHACMGADTWRESGGETAHPLYEGALTLAGLRSGERVLDIGTGRGEILPTALRRGASEAVGVDYAEAAIELARRTLAAAGDPPEARALHADARRLPVPDAHFDLATMIDVVEHLTPDELDHALREGLRALRPGGRLFVHTALNPLIYDVTYRLQRALTPTRRRTWPANPRTDEEKRMHVNEQTPRSLRLALRRAGYSDVRASLGRWVHADFVPSKRARRTYHRLARVPGLRLLTIADVHAVAFRPVR